MITILNPRVSRQGFNWSLASRPGDLNGKTVGFLDNGKRNFGDYLDRTEELLRQEFSFEAIRRRKPTPFKGMPTELLEELAKRCDVIITGSGD
jgi:phosphoserine phosphatase